MAECRDRVREALPQSSVQLVGSASVSGFAPNDIDVVVLVDDVGSAAAALRGIFPPLYEADWRDDWAAFRDPGPPQVDLVVTRLGTKGDAHHRLAWQLLARDAQWLAEYREMKLTTGDYERRKAAFFDKLVASLPEVVS